MDIVKPTPLFFKHAVERNKDPPAPELLGEACDHMMATDKYAYTYTQEKHIQRETSLSHPHTQTPPYILLIFSKRINRGKRN